MCWILQLVHCKKRTSLFTEERKKTTHVNFFVSQVTVFGHTLFEFMFGFSNEMVRHFIRTQSCRRS